MSRTDRDRTQLNRVFVVSQSQNGLAYSALSEDQNTEIRWIQPGVDLVSTDFKPQVVIIDGDTGVSCEGLIRQARASGAPPVIITVGDVPTADFRALIGYPRAHAVSAEIAPADLRRLIRDALKDGRVPADSGKSGECWVFTGAVGGAGVSLIAIETAYRILQNIRKENKRVCLIDLNFEDGSLPTYLDISPGLDIGALCGSPERIDGALLSAFISEHDSGLSLLAAPRGAIFNHRISPEAILRLLEVACDAYDYVVIDMPRWRQPWTAPLLQGADQVVIVSELTVPALHAARNLTEDIERLSRHTVEPEIVLNRMAKRVFGHSVSVGQAETALQRKSLTSISSDWDAAAAAVNMGMPVSMAKPGSRLSKDVISMIEWLMASQAEKAEREVA